MRSGARTGQNLHRRRFHFLIACPTGTQQPYPWPLGLAWQGASTAKLPIGDSISHVPPKCLNPEFPSHLLMYLALDKNVSEALRTLEI